MSIGQLVSFEFSKKQWPEYIRSIKHYMLLNGVKAELKVPLLIMVVGDATYALMCDLCSPALPEEKTFEQLDKLMTDHLEPQQRSEIAERHVFRLRRQSAGEPLAEYLQSIKHLASTCSFGTALEENLRDQFVSGLANEAMRSRIFAEKNIQYKEAVELAFALEAAEKHAEVSGSTVAPASTSGGGGGGGGAGEGLHYTSGRRGGRGASRGPGYSGVVSVSSKEGAVDTNVSEEEEGCPEAAQEDAEPEEQQPDTMQHVLPITEHQPAFEVSASQLNFLKMLDQKIEEGKDYDSSSETEIAEEEERKRRLIEHWCSFSQSTQSPVCTPSPPTPAARCHMTRSVSRASERQCAPSTSKQGYRQESPPTRSIHSAQTHDPRPSTSGEWDPSKSPIKRTQSAGPSWRGAPKVAPMPKPKNDEPVAGCSKDSHHITYNPTFQNHSPAHSAKSQPYVAQLVSSASPTTYIAPPEEYQDPDGNTVDRQATLSQDKSQIYYIHGNAATTSDIVQQRQQTAIRLKQYVAMKQTQHHMFGSYVQRSPHAVYPGGEYPPNTPRMYEGEELAAQYGYPGPRSQSAPSRAHIEVTHVQIPIWNPLPPVMTTPWAGGVIPPEMQYYPQSQFVPMYRANSAGSAGTLTRYHKKEESEKTVQSISLVRGKPVGQIMAVSGQELAVSSTVSDSPSPASVSTDSGMSPGTSAPSSKSSCSSTPPTTSANKTFEPHSKPKKNKSSSNRSLQASKSLDA